MLQYDLHDHPDGMVIAISGDLDTVAAQELDLRIEAIISTLDSDLAVDLSRLAYLNSTGVRSFIRLDKLLKGKGRKFVFRGVSQRIFRIFRYCGLDAYFRFETDLGLCV